MAARAASHRPMLGLVLLCLLGLPALAHGALQVANGWLDDSAPRALELEVVDTRHTTHKKNSKVTHRYAVAVDAGLPANGRTWLAVPADQWQRVEVGRTHIGVLLQEGRFGFPWREGQALRESTLRPSDPRPSDQR